MNCKECNYHKLYPIYQGLKDRHWCNHPKVIIYQTQDKNMSAKEAKSRPEWCPLKVIEEEKIKEHVERLVRKINNDTVLKYK